MSKDSVMDRVRAIAGDVGVALAPLEPALKVIAGPAERNAAAITIRHDRSRVGIRVGLPEPAERAAAPALIEALAPIAPGVRALARRAAAAAAGTDPAGVEIEAPGGGMAIYGPGMPWTSALDALGMTGDALGMASAVLGLVGRASCDSVVWRFRPPALSTLTVAFAAPPGGDGVAWSAGIVRALSMVIGMSDGGRGVINTVLDGGLPIGQAVVWFTASSDALLPRIGLDVDGVMLRDAAGVLARLPDGASAKLTAASVPMLGAESAGSLSLTFGDEPYGALVCAVMP